MRRLMIASMLAASGISAVPAAAASIAVANASFETQVLGDSFGYCGTGCSFSTNGIAGWAVSSGGQFLPGPPATTTYFDYVPDGVTVAYSNGGTISQVLTAVGRAGGIYTLKVDLGVRHDIGNPGSAALVIGANTIAAVGAPAAAGGWSTYTATYTATLADAGAPISIVLSTPGAQGDFDNVRLGGVGIPEPGTWALFVMGFGALGLAQRRRRALAA